jgi:deoxyxylulose-5-phosphate synthase
MISIRREGLDHVVVFGERHLRHVLLSYMHYYNSARTHLSLNNAPVLQALPRSGLLADTNTIHRGFLVAGMEGPREIRLASSARRVEFRNHLLYLSQGRSQPVNCRFPEPAIHRLRSHIVRAYSTALSAAAKLALSTGSLGAPL